MGKCFVTKLKGSTDNEALLKLNDFNIHINKKAPISENANPWKLNLGVNAATTATLTGEGTFTDITFTANNGNSKSLNLWSDDIVVSRDKEFDLRINSKYNLVKIATYSESCLCVNLDDLRYLTSLSIIDLQGDSSGDLSSLKDIISLTEISFHSMQNVTGDISSLKNLNLNSLALNYLNNITGDVSNLTNMSNLTGLELKGSKVTGDLAKLPVKVQYASFTDVTSHFTWSERSESANIITLAGNPYLGEYVDAMLINQAKCIAKPLSPDPWNTTISCVGNRTSASDAAVQTLQSKGYTVSIAPA